MGQVRKIGEEYYIEFYARGLLYQKKAGLEHDAALRMLEDIESKIAHGEMGTIVRDVDIDVFFKTFLEQTKEEHTHKTLERFEKTLKHFEGFLQKKYPNLTKLSAVTPVVMEKYRAFLMEEAKSVKPAVKPHILNLTLVLFESVLDHALKLGYLNDHPMLHLAWVPEAKVRALKYFKEDKIQQLLNVRSPDEAKLIELMLLTGLDFNEIKNLDLANVDFEANQIKMVVDHNKSIKIIPMHFIVREILSQLKREGESLAVFFGKHDALDKEFSRSVIKNTFAYFALKRKLRLTELYQMMGYDDVVKVMRYIAFLNKKEIFI
jgi:site-specific recombinase XerD